MILHQREGVTVTVGVEIEGFIDHHPVHSTNFTFFICNNSCRQHHSDIPLSPEVYNFRTEHEPLTFINSIRGLQLLSSTIIYRTVDKIFFEQKLISLSIKFHHSIYSGDCFHFFGREGPESLQEVCQFLHLSVYSTVTSADCELKKKWVVNKEVEPTYFLRLAYPWAGQRFQLTSSLLNPSML